MSSPLIKGAGAPSKPGWKSDRLERLNEWADAQEANRPIIKEYVPDGRWLWTRFKGTVLDLVWGSVVGSMVTSLLVHLVFRYAATTTVTTTTTAAATATAAVTTTRWWATLLTIPTSTEQPMIQSLKGLEKLWTYQLQLCSLVLTFFLSLSFQHWQKIYNTSRQIQGRINDFCMLLVMAADRQEQQQQQQGEGGGGGEGEEKSTSTTIINSNNNSSKSIFTTASQQELKTMTRLIRMSHTLFWAATPTTSNGLSDSEDYLTNDSENCHIPIDDDHIGPIMLSPYGLRALQESGQLTKQEVQTLLQTGLPPSQYPYVLLQWVGIRMMKALHGGENTTNNNSTNNNNNDNIFIGGPGLEGSLIQQLTQLRSSMFDIDDFRAGRMPMAYVQLVQILVDSLVILAPFALYPETGALSIPLSGLLALFFRGLLALSKSFLDPFGVEGYASQNMKVDVLVSELNFGASKRWYQAGAVLPQRQDV